MRISVIIPAYNEENFLPSLLHSIRKQTLQPFEILVVDNESTDSTAKVAKELGAKVLFIPKNGFSVSRARNAGGREARGEIFCFIDADTVLTDERTFGRVVWHVRRGVVGGFFKSRPIEKSLRGAFFWPLINFSKHFVYASSGLMYSTREAYQSVGGFNEEREVGEDLEFTRALSKMGPFEYDPGICLGLSDRRMLNEGYLKVLWKWFEAARKGGKGVEYEADVAR